MTTVPKILATIDDLLSLPSDSRAELLDGEIIYKVLPTIHHGRNQSRLAHLLVPYDKKPQQSGPGGWWICTEVEVRYNNNNCFRHDLVGWRRDRLPQLPDDFPISIIPDWVCEITSSNRGNDLIRKKRVLLNARMPDYWIADMKYQILSSLRWTAEGYNIAGEAGVGEKVSFSPFPEIELDVSVIFGQDSE